MITSLAMSQIEKEKEKEKEKPLTWMIVSWKRFLNVLVKQMVNL
jgi:hypothetical protein